MPGKLQDRENVPDHGRHYLPRATLGVALSCKPADSPRDNRSVFRAVAAIRFFRISVLTRADPLPRQRSRPPIARWFPWAPIREGPCSDPRSQGQIATWQFSHY